MDAHDLLNTILPEAEAFAGDDKGQHTAVYLYHDDGTRERLPMQYPRILDVITDAVAEAAELADRAGAVDFVTAFEVEQTGKRILMVFANADGERAVSAFIDDEGELVAAEYQRPGEDNEPNAYFVIPSDWHGRTGEIIMALSN